jgi:hypothetical protein
MGADGQLLEAELCLRPDLCLTYILGVVPYNAAIELNLPVSGGGVSG